GRHPTRRTTGRALGRGTARANRAGLTTLGLILFAGGGAAVSRGLGAFGPDAAAQPLLNPDLTSLTRQGWFWPAVAATSLVVALIGLTWLLALLRPGRLRRLRLESGPTGITQINSRLATDTLAKQINNLPGVRHARASLRGTADKPALDVRVTTRDPAAVDSVLARLHDETFPALKTTLGFDHLPALVRLGFAKGRPPRHIH
ncbi:alkaline shock response membrane anchor protein AmaP, partial [Planotetraspora silvatica]|uniref:alkaline shock response membrane anchor protein AmaP n=1 Tax=Planotetraspora silvatica TaxID=234614 RepID=UPI0019513E84